MNSTRLEMRMAVEVRDENCRFAKSLQAHVSIPSEIFSLFVTLKSKHNKFLQYNVKKRYPISTIVDISSPTTFSLI